MRHDTQNHFCTICCLRILGKDVGNRQTSMGTVCLWVCQRNPPGAPNVQKANLSDVWGNFLGTIRGWPHRTRHACVYTHIHVYIHIYVWIFADYLTYAWISMEHLIYAWIFPEHTIYAWILPVHLIYAWISTEPSFSVIHMHSWFTALIIKWAGLVTAFIRE